MEELAKLIENLNKKESEILGEIIKDMLKEPNFKKEFDKMFQVQEDMLPLAGIEHKKEIPKLKNWRKRK